MRQILHDWPDEKCRVILTHIRDAMRPGYSRLLVCENVLIDFGAPWQQTCLDISMMGLQVALERTAKGFDELFGSVGLRVNQMYERGGTTEMVLEVVRDV